MLSLEMTDISNFNNLYRNTEINSKYNDFYYIKRTTPDLSNKGYEQLYKNLPNGLNVNGRPYQQHFKQPSINIQYRDYDSGGRDFNLLDATNNRMIDVSGQYYRAADIPKHPYIQTKQLGQGRN